MTRRLIPFATALVLLLLIPSAAGAVAPNPNPWRGLGFLNIAHQGGEDEAPSNTMYAFKSAMAERGADMLELDVHLTLDQQLVVIHDDTLNRTTDCQDPRPTCQVRSMNLADIQARDAGYWFRPNSYSHSAPPEEYLLRGIRTGATPPPPGYVADDFRIPTLQEVLDTFPNTPINIEIKLPKSGPGNTDDPTLAMPTAEKLADLLDTPPYSTRDDLIVVSFEQTVVSHFHDEDMGGDVALAPGIAGVAFYYLAAQPPVPDAAAFQVPPSFQGLEGIPEKLLDTGAHADGYAIHVWPTGDEPDGEASYARFVAMGVEGYMASQPLRLHNFLCSEGVPRPNGTLRGPTCIKPPPTAAAAAPQRKCKKGKKLRRGKCVKKKRKKKR